MGAVYQAEHLHMHKRLAVKVLHPEMCRLPEIVARFEREAMAAGHIDHPNVATASDFGKLPDGSFFLVLEYIEGKSLREVLGGRPIELGRALHIAQQIAGALGRAHALGIVHRDVKPENIMILERDGDPDFVKVLDFGIAKVPVGDLGDAPRAPSPGHALTQLGAIFGTPDYMSPEQAVGQPVDGRADLYSLGVLLFEMLAGVVPFEHENPVMVLGMHVTAPAPTVASKAHLDIPAEVEALVGCLLAKEADKRFEDARQLALAIHATRTRLAETGRIVLYEPPRSMLRGPESLGSPGSSGLASANTHLHTPAAPSTMPVAHFVAGLETKGRYAFGVTKNLVARTNKRTRLVVGGALGGLMLLLVLRLTVSHGTGAQTVGAPTLTDSTSTATTASAPATPLVEHPDGHRDLERADMVKGDLKAALGEAGQWLKADPSATDDGKLATDLRTIALAGEDADAAIALLEAMGSVGVDALYDLAYGYAPGPVTPKARKALALPGVVSRASPSLTVALDFRAARTCEKKKALLDRARQHGDIRTLALLREYQTTTGCGFMNRKDCWSCLHKDDALASTIAAISEREHAP